MMFFILDKDPRESVKYLVENMPLSFCLSHLYQIGILLCSCGYSDVYSRVPQGKDVKKWIKKNIAWVSEYYFALKQYVVRLNSNLSPNTVLKFHSIYRAVAKECLGVYIEQWEPRTGIFKFTSEYKTSFYKNDYELLINDCIKEYKKYLKWKSNILCRKAQERKQVRLDMVRVG